MKKGIIVLKDPANGQIVANEFPEWLVIISESAEEEISFYKEQT